MNELKELQPITKAAYKRKIKAFHVNHEWLRPFLHLRPAPGHIELCEKMLKDIELLVGQDINNYFSGFYICDEGTTLKVIFSVNENIHPHSVRDTISAITNSTRYFSSITCSICGALSTEIKYIKLPTKNYCKLHKQLAQVGLLFLEEFNHFEINEDELLQKGDHARYLTTETKKKIFENPEPPQDYSKGYVQIFDPSDFFKISEKIHTMSKDNQSRFRQIIEKTSAAGESGYRKLAIFKNADDQLNKFIDEFPNFKQLGNHLKDLASLYALTDSRIKTPPLLLVGQPGIGKTEACYRIAQMFEIGFKSFDMSSAQSGAFLMGSDSFWSNSQVGKLFEQLCYNNCGNPLIMIDELDKANAENRFDPLGGLYSLLEETTAKNFSDLSCKDIKIDASHINWIATANDLKNIPDPILTRFTIIEIKKPDAGQSRTIGMNIYKKILESHPWGDHFEPYLEEVVLHAITQLEPRLQKKMLLSALASAARNGRKNVIEEDFKSIMVKQKQMGFVH